MALRFSLALPLVPIWAIVQVQSGRHNQAAAPSPLIEDCSGLLLNLVDCVAFVSSDTAGAAEKPEVACCSGLKTVLKTDARCLCEAFNNMASVGLTLDTTKAMSLPAACNLQAPPAAQCQSSLMSPSGALGVYATAAAAGPAPALAMEVNNEPDPDNGGNEPAPDRRSPGRWS